MLLSPNSIRLEVMSDDVGEMLDEPGLNDQDKETEGQKPAQKEVYDPTAVLLEPYRLDNPGFLATFFGDKEVS